MHTIMITTACFKATLILIPMKQATRKTFAGYKVTPNGAALHFPLQEDGLDRCVLNDLSSFASNHR
jgi:hypothetical protein